MRIIRRLNGKPIIDIDINDNYEEWYFYHKGHLSNKVRHDFNSSQTEETYFFDAIPNKKICNPYQNQTISNSLNTIRAIP